MNLSQLVNHAQKLNSDVKEEEKRQRLLEAEALAAWRILSPAGRDEVTRQELLEVLRLMWPAMTMKEVKQLTGASGSFSMDHLLSALSSDYLKDYDAVGAAFKVLDPGSRGQVDTRILGMLLKSLPGVQHLTDDDRETMVRLADADKDGRISLQDFQQILAPVAPGAGAARQSSSC